MRKNTAFLIIALLFFWGCSAPKEQGTKKVIDDILKSALQNENFFVRSAAAKAIGEMGDPKYVPLLIPMLKDPMAFVRLFTAESIAQLRGPDTLRLLLAVGGDSDPMVKIAVVKALDDLAKENGKIDGLPIEKILDSFTKDHDATVLLFAKAALAKRGNEKMFLDIQDALRNEDAIAPAVVALGRTKLVNAVPILTKTSQNADSTLRLFSAEALGEIGSSSAFMPLVALTKDKEGSVRSSAATSLGKIAEKNAIPILEGLLKDTEISVQLSAAEGLARYGKNRFDIYEKAMENADYGVRHSAIGSLQKLWGTTPGGISGLVGPLKKEAVPILMKALSDKSQRVRIAAVRAIGAMSGPEAIPILQPILHDADLSVRAYAAGNLGRWIR